ncbi:hypothetical protein [Kitasatospora sp. NPDC015120]|uniref:hypothetical protein n=1 Tax=Kitasatospora sp. NPDC015120 TaxID=3364023 RepID=UPI0036F45357
MFSKRTASCAAVLTLAWGMVAATAPSASAEDVPTPAAACFVILVTDRDPQGAIASCIFASNTDQVQAEATCKALSSGQEYTVEGPWVWANSSSSTASCNSGDRVVSGKANQR